MTFPDPLKIENFSFVFVDAASYLGVIFQSTLRWNLHITSTIKKAYGAIYSIRPYLFYLSNTKSILLYSSLVRPILEYGSATFSNALPAYLASALERVQTHFLRLVIGNFTLPYDSLLAFFRINTVQDRFRFLVLEKFVKCFQVAHPHLKQFFPAFRKDIVQRSTRSNDLFYISVPRTNLAKNTFFNACALLWNRLFAIFDVFDFNVFRVLRDKFLSPFV